MIVDLDHFKHINDNHGHPAGDAVLREAARRMQNSVRQYDSIGRYGGEEFLILFPGCGEAESFRAGRTSAQAARPDRNSRQRHLACASPPASVSRPPSRANLGPPKASIRKADEALYLAKKSGRNRVEILSCRTDSAPANPSKHGRYRATNRASHYSYRWRLLVASLLRT